MPQFLVAAHLLAESDEVLTVSARIAAHVVHRLPLRILEPPIALPRYGLDLLWHPRHNLDPAHTWMRRLFLEASRALPEVCADGPERRTQTIAYAAGGAEQ